MYCLMQAMSKEFTDVVFLKVDVDECEDVASDYNISCMPTFLYLKKSEKVILEVNILIPHSLNFSLQTTCM